MEDNQLLLLESVIENLQGTVVVVAAHAVDGGYDDGGDGGAKAVDY